MLLAFAYTINVSRPDAYALLTDSADATAYWRKLKPPCLKAKL